MEEENKVTLHIKEIAELSKIDIKEIHFYEEIGLIRSINKFPYKRSRLFHIETVAKVIWIKRFLELGFSWAQIRKIMDLWIEEKEYPSEEKLQSIFNNRIEALTSEIKRLEKLREEIQKLSEKLNNSENIKQFLLSVIPDRSLQKSRNLP